MEKFAEESEVLIDNCKDAFSAVLEVQKAIYEAEWQKLTDEAKQITKAAVEAEKKAAAEVKRAKAAKIDAKRRRAVAELDADDKVKNKRQKLDTDYKQMVDDTKEDQKAVKTKILVDHAVFIKPSSLPRSFTTEPCAICLKSLICQVDRCYLLSACGHCFHPKCISQWVKPPADIMDAGGRDKCPKCRVPIIGGIELWRRGRENREQDKKRKVEIEGELAAKKIELEKEMALELERRLAAVRDAERARMDETLAAQAAEIQRLRALQGRAPQLQVPSEVPTTGQPEQPQPTSPNSELAPYMAGLNMSEQPHYDLTQDSPDAVSMMTN